MFRYLIACYVRTVGYTQPLYFQQFRIYRILCVFLAKFFHLFI